LIQGDRRDIKKEEKPSKDGNRQIVEDCSCGRDVEFEKQEMGSETEHKENASDYESGSDSLTGQPVRKRLFETHGYYPAIVTNYILFTRKR
jgi:hypothetical protein